MSSNNENDAYDSSLNSDNDSPTTTPSGPPDPHKTPDRRPPLGCPPRQKIVRTGDRITLTDETVHVVTRPICVPVMHAVNGSHNDAENVIAEDRYPQLGNEAKGWMVGPMPEKPFLDRFLPYNTTPGTPTRPPKQNLPGQDSTTNASPDTLEPVEVPTSGGFASIQFPVQNEEDMYEHLVSTRRSCNSHT